MNRILRNNSFIRLSSTNVIALLLIYMSDLKPNIGIGKRARGIAQNAIEAA
jgi:hypothetical protein